MNMPSPEARGQPLLDTVVIVMKMPSPEARGWTSQPLCLLSKASRIEFRPRIGHVG